MNSIYLKIKSFLILTVLLTVFTGNLYAQVDCHSLLPWTNYNEYQNGAEVRFNQIKYRAKWYTMNGQPGDPYGPWENLGNCSDDNTTTVDCSNYSTWSSTAVYQGTEEVYYQGKIFKARSYNQNQTPGQLGSAWNLIAICNTGSTPTPPTPVGNWSINGNSGHTSANFLGTTDNKPIIFKTNNVERARLNANGNFGIGETNPQYALDVNGVANFEHLRMTTNARAGYIFTCDADGNGTWTAPLLVNKWITLNSYYTYNGDVNVNGILKIGNSSLFLGSQATQTGVTNEIYTSPGQDLLFQASQGNNVGVGTTSPTGKFHISVPPSSNLIQGVNIDVQSFGNNANAAQSHYLRMRDIGAGNKDLFIVYGNGKVGIGTSDLPGNHLLYVKGSIICEELNVKLNGNWPDYVFEENYKLLSLDSLENYLKVEKHLPDVPSEEELKEQGINAAEMDAMLLKKIEELTLYMIQLQKQNQELRKELEVYKK